MADTQKIAIILIRGLQGVTQDIKDTLRMLNIERRNVCVVVPSNRSMHGMINKIKNFVTYGEIDDETEKLLEKKGKKKFYNLNSPRKGYGRKGVKKDFARGGALGYRGDKINDLIKRMI